MFYFLNPFLIDSFYEKSDFEELKGILESKDVKEIAYTKQMNKWEDSVPIPQHFFDKAIKRIQDILGTNDIELGYYLLRSSSDYIRRSQTILTGSSRLVSRVLHG